MFLIGKHDKITKKRQFSKVITKNQFGKIRKVYILTLIEL